MLAQKIQNSHKVKKLMNMKQGAKTEINECTPDCDDVRIYVGGGPKIEREREQGKVLGWHALKIKIAIKLYPRRLSHLNP